MARGLLDECYRTRSPEAVQKLRDAHLVRSLTVNLAKAKYLCGAKGIETEEFESLLSELCLFISRENGASAPHKTGV